MKKIAVIATLVAQLIFCGCASYRFDADIENNTVSTIRGRYRIDEIKFNVDMAENPHSKQTQLNSFAPPEVGAFMDEKDLREFAARRYPGVFDDTESATPLAIQIFANKAVTRYEWTVLFPYLLSLGVLPGGREVVSTANMKVYVGGRLVSTCMMDYASALKVTAFSPFGAIPFSKDIDRQYVNRDELILNFLAVDKTIRNLGEQTFCETFADGLVSCLVEYEGSSKE